MRIKTIKIKLYKFNELSSETQEKAINNLWNINVSHEWWDYTYDDAENIGLKITEFDIDHHFISGELTKNIEEVVKLILNNHGKTCDTYKLALEWKEFESFDDEGSYIDDYDEKRELFEHDLLQEYLIILNKDAEYLTSKEAIIETIESNEYEFTEDGKIGC